MKRSAEVDQIIPAFVALLAELEDITRNRTADAGKFSYNYADLGSVLATSRPKAKEHGLAITQEPHTTETGTAVSTHVLHISGQWLEYDPLRLPASNDAQSHGSAISFARRYAMLSVLGLATEDDDGVAARQPDRPTTATSAPRPAETHTGGNGASTEPPAVQAVADEIGKGVGYIVAIARKVAESHDMPTVKGANDISPELIVLVREKLGLA